MTSPASEPQAAPCRRAASAGEISRAGMVAFISPLACKVRVPAEAGIDWADDAPFAAQMAAPIPLGRLGVSRPPVRGKDRIWEEGVLAERAQVSRLDVPSSPSTQTSRRISALLRGGSSRLGR